jgi:hypothetical protein
MADLSQPLADFGQFSASLALCLACHSEEPQATRNLALS